MATTVSYTASLKTRNRNSSSNVKSGIAGQEFYTPGDNYVGIICFPDMRLANKVIMGISLTTQSKGAGYGASHEKTVYLRKATHQNYIWEGITGAAYAGARSMVTMKQMGLNVASDPLAFNTVIENFRNTMIFSGYEVGNKIKTGFDEEQEDRCRARHQKKPQDGEFPEDPGDHFAVVPEGRDPELPVCGDSQVPDQGKISRNGRRVTEGTDFPRSQDPCYIRLDHERYDHRQHLIGQIIYVVFLNARFLH